MVKAQSYILPNKIGFVPTGGDYETGYFNRHSDQSRSKLHGASGQLRHIGSRFPSKRPIRDIYAVIETPEKSGLVMNASTAITPELHAQSDED